jgi:signal peptidase II
MNKYAWFVIALVLSLGADQGSKMWARHSLRPMYPQTVKVVPGFFELRYSENPGSAFGLFRNVPGARYLLFVIGIIALFVVANMLRKAKETELRVAAELGLLAGGALGNIIDRIFYGRVTDFVVWGKVGTQFEWPTFNIADAALVLGVLGLLIDQKDTKKTPPPKKTKQSR